MSDNIPHVALVIQINFGGNVVVSPRLSRESFILVGLEQLRMKGGKDVVEAIW